MSGPLDGITVLDLTRVLSGPICGRALSDLGARVIKVEPPTGDLTRFSLPRHGAISGYYAQQNSGKENISIDLDKDEGRDLLARLAARSDVVLENFRPGVCAKLGVGYEAVAAANPGVVFASLTGFGQTGPWAHRRAYAVVAHAASGYTEHQLSHQERVAGASVLANDGFSHADVYAGLLTLSGILAALHSRHHTGRGQHVDVSMVDAMVFVDEHVQERLSNEIEPGHPGILGSGWSPVVRVASGELVSVAGDAGGVAMERFLRVLGRDDLLADPVMKTWDGRIEHGPRLRSDFVEFASHVPDADSLISLLDDEGIAAATVESLAALSESEFATHRGTFVDVDDRSGGTFRIPQAPWRFSATPAGVSGPPAWRGEHNRSVCRDVLGLDDDEIVALEGAGALVSRPPRVR